MGTPRRTDLCRALLSRAHHIQTAFEALQRDRQQVTEYEHQLKDEIVKSKTGEAQPMWYEMLAAVTEKHAERERVFRTLTSSVDSVLYVLNVYADHYPSEGRRFRGVREEVLRVARNRIQRVGVQVYATGTVVDDPLQGLDINSTVISPSDQTLETLLQGHDPDASSIYTGIHPCMPQYFSDDVHIGCTKTMVQVLSVSGWGK
jgi:hypothetical protein